MSVKIKKEHAILNVWTKSKHLGKLNGLNRTRTQN